MHIPILYRWIHLSILHLLFLLLQQRRKRSNVPIAIWAWKQQRKLDSLTKKTITKPISFADTTSVGEHFQIKLNTTCISLNTIMIIEEFKQVSFLFNLFFFSFWSIFVFYLFCFNPFFPFYPFVFRFWKDIKRMTQKKEQQN